MLARSLIKQCSPTMAGIKTGNLLILDQYSEEEISAFNQMAKDKGIAAVFLGIKNGRTLIYVYRPDLLKKDLDDPLAQKILSSEGDRFNTPKECITCLIDRINNSPSFPHEIGLMLGYPPEDVKGFIENSGSGFKSCGMWKVYGDVKKASCIWDRYKKCTDIYSRLYDQGTDIEGLIVAC